MRFETILQCAVAAVPAGTWAVGVSGGADSVALLRLLRQRRDLQLHVVHLNHETRGDASDGDARFVASLAASWGLPCTVARLSEVPIADAPRNPSARYRAARLELFRRVVASEHVAGVILAHHADDQAETIFHRLLRGGGAVGLAGMQNKSRLAGLVVVRPLLAIGRDLLREELSAHSIAWREDASNASSRYLRNRLRRILQRHPGLREPLLHLGAACGRWRKWLDAAAPRLADSFAVRLLQELPAPLAAHAARRWLRERGCPAEELGPEVLARLLTMVNDAASMPRRQFPGGVLVRRKSGKIAYVPAIPSSGTPRFD